MNTGSELVNQLVQKMVLLSLRLVWPFWFFLLMRDLVTANIGLLVQTLLNIKTLYAETDRYTFQC